MQQLNFLSIAATQNVDIKDGAPAVFSPLLKDDFSQHIESHLAKNKDVPDFKSEGDGIITVPMNANDEPSVLEQRATESENISGENKESVTLAQLSTDEHNLVNETQEVAATGNNSEIKSNQKTPDTVNQGINESELLMSFLNKADKTLVAKAAVDTEKGGQSLTDKNVMSSTYPKNVVKEVQFNVIADDQKIKQVAPLLNSSDLSTDLSSVAKVVGSSSETDSDYLLEQDKSLDLTKENAKDAKESVASINASKNVNSVNSKIDITDGANSKNVDQKQLIETQSLNTKIINTNVPSQLDRDAVKKGLNEPSSENQKSIGVTPNNHAPAPSQAELTQQNIMLENDKTKSNDIDSQLAVKSLPGSQAIMTTVSQTITQITKETTEQLTSQTSIAKNLANASPNAQNLSESEVFGDEHEQTLVNVKKVQHDKVQHEKVQHEKVQYEKGMPQTSENITTVTASGKSALSQLELSQTAKNLPGMSQPTNSKFSVQDNIINASSERLGRTGTEPLINEHTLTESEEQFSVKAAENLIAQTKSDVTVENKDVGTIAMANTLDKANTAFAFNVTASEATNRATQAAYDRIDHQAIDMVNPTSSVDVTQNQKTNTQLHHETIAIFRKDFSDAVKDKVMLMISQKLQQFDITLDPPELGNMQVRVNLQGEQATVNFVVQNQHAKEALDQNMHKLREMLAEQGVDVGDANVEQQSQQSNNNETADDKPRHSAINTADASDVIEHNLSAKNVDSTTQVIDYYA